MSPKLVIQAMAVLLMVVPAALAEEAMPASAGEMPAAADPVVEAAASAPTEESAAPKSAPIALEAEAAQDDAMAALEEEAVAPAVDVSPADAAPGAETQSAIAAAESPGELAPPPAPSPQSPDAPIEPFNAEPALDTHPPLGAIGYDSHGRRGRIHIVVSGDTLWDVSDAYLGTPWVWPSIWHDNGEIENPHLIHPGDRIWITPSEMRRISAEEAVLLLSNLPAEPAGEPAALGELPLDTVGPETSELPPTLVAEPVERGSLRVSSRESAGLITPDQLEAAASIVGRVPERVFVSQEDDVSLGFGESAVAVGAQLTLFRTRALLGYHVEFLGWVEVKETLAETSIATIRMSTGELEEGDRLIPRERLPHTIALQASPDVSGKISFFPQKRVVIGYNDFVFLNRGSVDGLEVGSPLDVYRAGYTAEETARGDLVLVPDYVIGRLLVVRAEAESAVALVMGAKTELALGDRFRGAGR